MSKTINDSEKSDRAVDATRQARAPRSNIYELGQLLPLNIRSLALTGIFIILLVYTLKIGSIFFIPVVLALLLSFVFASVIRLLSRFYVPAPLGAAIVLLALLGSLALGIYRLAEPAREWMAKMPETVRQVERKLKNVKQSVQEVTKATKEFVDQFGRRKVKGNMDIELTVDAMELAKDIDHMVLFSGNGDFSALVGAMQRHGVRVTLVSTLPMVADELRRQADVFLDITNLRPKIERDERSQTGAKSTTLMDDPGDD